jgi:hypothetical protein
LKKKTSYPSHPQWALPWGHWVLRQKVKSIAFLCQSAFHHYDKIPEKINLKEEKFIIAHGFKDFSPWLGFLDPVTFGPPVRQ